MKKYIIILCFSLFYSFDSFGQEKSSNNEELVKKVSALLESKQNVTEEQRKIVSDKNTVYITGAKLEEIKEKIFKNREITEVDLIKSKEAQITGEDLEKLKNKLAAKKID